MNDILEQHRAMVLRLKKPGLDILNSMSAWDCDLTHMGGCLMGEAAELYELSKKPTTKKQKLEELGDFDFYLVACREIFQLNRSTTSRIHTGKRSESFKNITIELMETSGHFWDIVKRIVVYRKDWNAPDKKYDGNSLKTIGQGLLAKLEAHYNQLLYLLHITHQQVAQANWDKLADADKGRYATGSYSDEQAQNRRDEK